MRVVQISDLHMTPEGEVLHGLEPATRLRACDVLVMPYYFASIQCNQEPMLATTANNDASG